MARVGADNNIPFGWFLSDENTLVWSDNPRIFITKEATESEVIYWLVDEPFKSYSAAFAQAQELIKGDRPIDLRRFAPSIDATSREEYFKLLQESDKRRDQRDEQGRIPHIIVRGGRQALGRSPGSFVLQSNVTERRLMDVSEEFGARTQSLNLREMMRGVQRDNAERDEILIRNAITQLRWGPPAQPEAKFGFRVPYFEQELIDAGMPKKAASILIERARNTFFLESDKPLRSTQIKTILASLRYQSQRNIYIGTKNDKHSIIMEGIGSFKELRLSGERRPLRLKDGNRVDSNVMDNLIDARFVAVRKARDEFISNVSAIELRNERIEKENKKRKEQGLPSIDRIRVDPPPPEVNLDASDHLKDIFEELEKSARIEAGFKKINPVVVLVTFEGWNQELKTFGPTVFSVTLPDLQHSDEPTEHGSSVELGYRALEGITLDSLPAVLARLARRKKRRGRDLKPFRSNPARRIP